MSSPRESVIREFKKNEHLFLNYESTKPIRLGEIFMWRGRSAERDTVHTLATLGIQVPPKFNPRLPSDKLYISPRAQSRFARTTLPPVATMHFKYCGRSRYALQTYGATIESLDEVALAHAIDNAISHHSLNWNKDWIVVTSVWKAKAYTFTVSSEKSSAAEFSLDGAKLTNPFNIADVDAGVRMSDSSGLWSSEVATAGAFPYYIGMRYRKEGNVPFMRRYAGEWW